MARPLRTGSATGGILAFILGGSLAVGASPSFRPAPQATDDAPPQPRSNCLQTRSGTSAWAGRRR